MELDKDYISYLKAEGKMSEVICMYLEYIIEKLESEEPEEKNDLMGMYKIQPGGKSGLHKGPPPIII